MPQCTRRNEKIAGTAFKLKMETKPKIIVLDDDPTGSQTVHSCLLLKRQHLTTVADDLPIFFVLTNTRSLPPEQVASVTTEVCHNLKLAIDAEVSRIS